MHNSPQWNYVGDYDVRINDRQCNNNCYIPSFRGSNALIHCRTSDTSNVKVLQCAPGYYMYETEELTAPNPNNNNIVETHTLGKCNQCTTLHPQLNAPSDVLYIVQQKNRIIHM